MAAAPGGALAPPTLIDPLTGNFIAGIEPFDGLALNAFLLLNNAYKFTETDSNGLTAFAYACTNGKTDLAKYLNNLGAATGGLKITGPSGETPLGLACTAGHLDIIKVILAATGNRHLITDVDADGNTPIMVAAKIPKNDVLRLLLANASLLALIDGQDVNGITPFYHACEQGFLDTATLLAASGADINFKPVTNINTFWIASAAPHDDIIDFLVKNPLFDCNQKDAADDQTPLIWLVENDRVPDIIEIVKLDNLDVNEKDANNNSALTLAAETSKPDIITELLKRDDIDVNLTNGAGETPLYISVREQDEDSVKLLVKRADIEANKVSLAGATALSHASQEGYNDIVTLLLTAPLIDVNKPETTLAANSPLILASYNDNLDVITLLLDAERIDVNQPNSDNRTPLWFAANQGHNDSVKLLLAAPGIDLNIKESGTGFTALHTAVDEGKTDVVTTLLEDVRTEVYAYAANNVTALWIAASKGLVDIIPLFFAIPPTPTSAQVKTVATVGGKASDALKAFIAARIAVNAAAAQTAGETQILADFTTFEETNNTAAKITDKATARQRIRNNLHLPNEQLAIAAAKQVEDDTVVSYYMSSFYLGAW